MSRSTEAEIAAARAWYAINLERCVDRLMTTMAPWQTADANPAFVRARLHGAVRGIVASMALPTITHLIEIDIGRTLAELYPPSTDALHAVWVAVFQSLTADLPEPMLALAREGISRAMADIVWGYARNGMVPRTVGSASPASAPSARAASPEPARKAGNDDPGRVDVAWCRTFAANHPFTILINDLESGDLVAASPTLERTLGYTADEIDHLTDEQLISPDSPDDDYDQGIDLLSGKVDLVERIGRFIHKDGHVVTLELRFWVVGAPGSSPRFMFTEMHPTVTDEAVWVEADRRFRHLAQLTPDPLVIVDREGRVRYASPAIERTLGVAPDQAIGMSLAGFARDDDRDGVDALVGRLRDSPPRTTDRADVRLDRADGFRGWFELIGTNLQDVPGLNGIIIHAREVSAHKEVAALLEEQARLDPLTGLSNRRGIIQRLEQEIARFAATGATAAVISIDLDGFKTINDRFGHPVGDQFLVEAGRRLVEAIDPDNLAGRIGGDEFIVIVPDTTLPHARDIAERIITTLNAPYPYEDEALHIGCGLGLVLLQQPDPTVASVLAGADAALYRAKAHHDGQPQIGLPTTPGS